MLQLETTTRFLWAFLLAAVFSFVIFMWQGSSYLFLAGEDYEQEVVNIQIPLGASTHTISLILAEEGIISNASLFRFYASYKGFDQDLQAGDFQLHRKMTLADILTKLMGGQIQREQVRIMIPEGLTALQTATHLAEAGLGDEEEFLALMSSGEEFPSFDFLLEIPVERAFPLEGYIFPDTYYVHKGAGEREILNMMLQRFAVFYTSSVQERIAEMDFSLHEVVTLAAIVEREATVNEERPLIAAVFLNRLQKGWLLQSCATVQYALGEVKPVLLYKDLEIQSPYNTYLYPGLPPGPIASPGEASLQAVLNPADVNYMFFVAKGDGTGEHYFAKDLAGHNRNRRKARRN